MQISWGVRITLLYSSFVALMLTLVVASSRQKFDLVSKEYYRDEIAYQDVIDAGKNQAGLSEPVDISANEQIVTIRFPREFKDKVVVGSVQFYSPVNAEWDRSFKVDAGGGDMTIDRNKLRNTKYQVKITCSADGKNYYQESEIQLHDR